MLTLNRPDITERKLIELLFAAKADNSVSSDVDKAALHAIMMGYRDLR